MISHIEIEDTDGVAIYADDDVAQIILYDENSTDIGQISMPREVLDAIHAAVEDLYREEAGKPTAKIFQLHRED